MRKRLISITLLIALAAKIEITIAQTAGKITYPVSGDTLADHEFVHIDNYPSATLKISDFRGKWVVVDFWSRYCAGCIASFPKMNRLDSLFKDDIKLIMVGLEFPLHNGRDTITRKLYERMKSIHGLKFTTAFDTLARTKYAIEGLPSIFVINPDGVLVAKALSIDEQQIRALLRGERPHFKRSFSANEKLEYQESLPLLTNGDFANGGIDTSFSFRSMLVPYNENLPLRIRSFDNNTIGSGTLEVSRVTLKHLYKLAYFGDMDWSYSHDNYQKYYGNVLLETSDSTLFVTDAHSYDKHFAYSLTVPRNRASRSLMMKMMQDDLNSYFGYNAEVAKRSVTVYRMIVSDPVKARKLKTKGGKLEYHVNNTKYEGIAVSNFKIDDLVRMLYSLCSPNFSVPIFNDTGIDYNIDIKVHAKDMMDLGSVNTELDKYGLQIVSGKKIMETLVLSDSKE